MPDPTPADRLLAHCEALADASPDGTFPLGRTSAGDALDTNADAGQAAVVVLARTGRLVRVRAGDAKHAAVYALADSPAALAAAASTGPALVTCRVCGRRYVPSGGADACPGFLSHPVVRSAWRRTPGRVA